MNIKHKLISSGFSVLNRTRISQFFAPLTQGCGAIFMLHRVRPARTSEFQPNAHLEITPEFLRTTVERIRANNYEIIALDEAISRLTSGLGHNRYAVLTFDDGYRDNLEVAYPILKELQVPFTIFVASGLVDGVSELWWEALERVIADNDEIVFSQDGGAQGIPCRSVEQKNTCFCKVLKHVTGDIDEQDQRSIIRALCERYNFDLRQLASDEIMSWEELRTLSSDPLVTIGAHTHDHFALARLERGDAEADILHGVKRLEQELGRRPKHFAYPYGKRHAVNKQVADILKAADFSSAVTTLPGILQSMNARNPLMLPRVSLNGNYQQAAVVDQFLTGAPFALFNTAEWFWSGCGLRKPISRLFPSTR